MRGRVKFTAVVVALLALGMVLALPLLDGGVAHAAKTSLTAGTTQAVTIPPVTPEGWFGNLFKKITKIIVCAVWDYFSDLPCPFWLYTRF